MSTLERLLGEQKFSYKKKPSGMTVQFASTQESWSFQHLGWNLPFVTKMLKTVLCVSINTHRIGIFPFLSSSSFFYLTSPQNLSWYNNIYCCQLFSRHRFIPWVLSSWNFVLSHWSCGSSGCTRWELYFYRHVFYIDVKYGATERCYAA